MPEQNPSILLFDGVCKFCHSSVQFAIKRDHKNRIVYCPLQSEKGQDLLRQYGLTDNGLTSMVLLDTKNHRAYRKSSAALHIARQIKFPWPLLYVFIVVPEFIRDAVYDFIGRHRYQWFGKFDSCWIPDDESRKKFID